MGRGNKHTTYHGSGSATDAISAADAQRLVEAAFGSQVGQLQLNNAGEGSQGSPSGKNVVSNPWWKLVEAFVYDICEIIDDRFIIPQNITAIPLLNNEGEEDQFSVAALIGYFISISTLMAFAAYSRRLSNLMSGASPVMGEIMFCVSHLTQVTQEQLGWSTFCSGFLPPSNFDWPASDGSGSNSPGGSSGGGSAGSSGAVSQALRRQLQGAAGGVGGGMNGVSGGGAGSGGSGSCGSVGGAGNGAGYAAYSGGNVVRYLLGRRASSFLRQESLRSYLYSSFYSPSAFLVEQACWFVVLIVTLDTVTLQRVAVASFFANAVGWVPVYSAGALIALATALLFVFMYWIPSYEIDDAVLSSLFLQTSLHRIMSAYCASLCITLLFAESMVLEDLRRTFVSTVFSLPQRVLRLSGNYPAVAQVLRACGEMRRNYFYFVDFYFFLGIMFWFSLVLMETAAGFSVLGVASLLVVVPWLIGCGWTTAPLSALKDTVVYVSFYGLVAITLAAVVPSSGIPFLSNAVQAAGIVMLMAARCEHKQPNGCAYVWIWVFMLSIYLYEKAGTGRGAAGSIIWSSDEAPSSWVPFASAAQLMLQGNTDASAEAMGIVRVVCVTFWQLISKSLSVEGARVLHFNVVVLGSMLLLSTSVRAVTAEGIGFSPATSTTNTNATTMVPFSSSSPTPAVSNTHAGQMSAPSPTTSTNTTTVVVTTGNTAITKGKKGSVALGPTTTSTDGAKSLGRSSRQESHSTSGANLDTYNSNVTDDAGEANTSVVSVTSEEDAIEEVKKIEKSPTSSPTKETPSAMEVEPATEKSDTCEAKPTPDAEKPAVAVTAVKAEAAEAEAKRDQDSLKTKEEVVVAQVKRTPSPPPAPAKVDEKQPFLRQDATGKKDEVAEKFGDAVEKAATAPFEKKPEAKSATPALERQEQTCPPATVAEKRPERASLPSPPTVTAAAKSPVESPQSTTLTAAPRTEVKKMEEDATANVAAGRTFVKTAATTTVNAAVNNNKTEERAAKKGGPDAVMVTAEKPAVEMLMNVSGAVGNASLTPPLSPSNGSLISPISPGNDKATTPTTSKTSQSSVSREEPRKKKRRRKGGRERKKLQKERRRASLLAEAEAKLAEAKLVEADQAEAKHSEEVQAVKSPDAASAKASVEAPTKTPLLPLPLPRSQMEGFKKVTAEPSKPAANAPGNVQKVEAAVNSKLLKRDAKAPPSPTNSMKVTATAAAGTAATTTAVEKRNGNPNNEQRDNVSAASTYAHPTEKRKAEKNEPANDENKSATPLVSTSAVAALVTGGAKEAANGSAAPVDNNNNKTSPKSPTTITPFPLPKPRHEQAAAGTAKVAAEAVNVPPVPIVTGPTLTAAEKLRRSTGDPVAACKEAQRERSLATNTPASQNPCATKAAGPAPLNPQIHATHATNASITATGVVSSAPAFAVKKSTPPLETAAAAAPSNAVAANAAAATLSVTLPLPRSAQSADAEAKKDSLQTRPAHTKADIVATEKAKQTGTKRASNAAAAEVTAKATAVEPAVRESFPATAAAMIEAGVRVAPPAQSDPPYVGIPKLSSPTAVEDTDESYDLDRVLNFLKLKANYPDDDGDRSSSCDSAGGSYRNDAFFHPETLIAAHAVNTRFPTVLTQVTSGSVGNTNLFSTVLQPPEHVALVHDLNGEAAVRLSMSGVPLHDTPQHVSQLLQPSSEWKAKASANIYSDVAGDSFASTTVAGSGGSFHVFSTHPQGTTVTAAAAANATTTRESSPRPQMLSPVLLQGASFNQGVVMQSNVLLRPAQAPERESMGSTVTTPPMFAAAGTPPTAYYQLPQQMPLHTPTSPMLDAQAQHQRQQMQQQQQQQMTFSISTVNSGTAASSFPDMIAANHHSNSSSGSSMLVSQNANSNANYSYNNNGSRTVTNNNTMGQITVGHPPHQNGWQQSVFTRLRAVPNPRVVTNEPKMMSPSPSQGTTAVSTMQPQATNINPPMMVMMPNAEGQMTLFPVVYNQPVYVLDQNGVVHHAQGPPPQRQQQQIMYTTTMATQGSAVRPQQNAMAYPMLQENTFIPTSPPQGPVQGVPQFSGQQQQRY